MNTILCLLLDSILLTPPSFKECPLNTFISYPILSLERYIIEPSYAPEYKMFDLVDTEKHVAGGKCPSYSSSGP